MEIPASAILCASASISSVMSRREVGRLSNIASGKKTEFLAEYNDLREEKLDLPPTNPSY